MRSRPQGDKTFSEFLQEVKNAALNAFEHPDYPFEELVQELNAGRDTSRNPLFDTMFALQNMDTTTWHIANLRARAYEYDWKSAKFDLLLQAEQDQDDICLTMEYAASLFRRETMERFADCLIRVLDTVTEHADKPIKDVDIVSEREKEYLTRQGKGERLPFAAQAGIAQLFEAQVLRTPNRIAIRSDDQGYTYEELNAKANQLARMLRSKGVGRGSMIAIRGERSFAYAAAILAVLKAGGAFMPVDAASPPSRIQYMAADSKAKLLLNAGVESVDLQDCEVLTVDEDMFQGNPANLEPTAGGRDVLYVIYTSGTTGTPKGVQISHSNLHNLFVHHQRQSNITLSGRVLHASAIGFDVCYQEMLLTLLSGGELVVIDDHVKKTPHLLLQYVTDNQIDTMFLPTAYFNFLIREDDEVDALFASSVKHIVVAGEALILSSRFMDLLRISSKSLHNHYGPSETHVVSALTINRDSDLQMRPSIGEPIANTEFYIVDQHLRLVPRGVVGELCIAGQSLGLGYLNQPELTRLAFVPNPVDKGTIMYRTGDLARWLPDGKVELIGRSDHQVKIRGYRIEPAEITAILLRHKEVSEAAATVKEQADGSKELCLFYVAETPLTPAYIRSYLAEKLPAFMIPSHIVPLKAMPFSANGKVDYRALPSAEKAQPPSMPAASAAPLTGLERQLAEIFAEVLEIKDIGREDNFFEQGGHSLRAMRAVSKIGKKLNRKLSLRDIFLHPSVRTLASFMDGQEARPFQAIPAAEAMRTYPLTSAQKRLFILEQYKGIGTSYNLSSALLVEGSLNVRQVEHVYQQLLRRHEILRTIFFMEGEEPVQQVVEQATGAIWYKEAPDSSEAELQELVSAFVRPFRMQEAPMLRIGLIRLNEKKHLFLIDMHHIVADGTSIGILVEEFMRLYRGESLPPLPVSYKDFTVWQKRRLLAPEMAEKERFWLERLAGELPVLQLPTDYSRPPQQRFEGKMLPFELDKALAVKLTELSHKTGATLYMILLSAFQVLLHKYSGSEDVLIGIPVAGRSHEDVEGAVGMFVNTLPFRGKPEPAKRFHDFMAEVKEELLLAFEHQDYPLELMIEKLNLKFDPSRNPLFTVIFDMQNMRVPELRLDDLTISVWRSEHISSKFDLSVSVHEHSEGIRFNCEYATSLFEQETVERLFRHYEALLSRIFVNPDARIQELNMVPDEEQDRILTAFNQPVTPVDERMLAHHVFERWAAKTPHAPAVAWMDTMLTYHELNQLANELCYVLQAKGTAANDVIAIYMNKSLDMVIAMLAILKAGAAFLPLDPEYPLERVQYAVDNSGAKIVIADASHCARVSCQTVLTYQHEKSRLEESCFPNPENDVQLHHLAYVIYTSGSTGNPKGVRVPHRGLANLTHFFALDWNAAQGERVTQMASFAFDMALLEIFTALLTGAALYLVPKETVLRPSSLAEFMNENRITIMTVTPSYLAYLEPDDFRTLRLLITAGEAISVHDYERWSRLEYVNLYGPTETTIITTMWRPDSSSRIKQSVPIGKPLPNTQIYILNQAGSLQPIGIVGEIYVGGEGVTQGYIQLPSTTAKHYLDNPFRLGERMYRTGDLGRWLPDGSIEYAGRIDEQVKLRGHRIEIGEIEHALLKHAAIKEAAVIHRIDGNQDGYLCAFIVEQEQVPAQELKDFLANVLPVYMLPSAFVRLDKLPVTSNGKIDKKQLKSMPIDVAGEAEYEEPANDLQRKLVALWEKNLKVAPIGIAHNFFDLGGQSLKATKLIAEIERDMQITISLRELYQYQTIKQLAQYLEEREGDE
ncbi:MAG: amino acid adenylation domain-containing protein [Paenibacillus dendritiformis]|nr:amino acid adenylation domain-containing protein [Paenibacillus dendritiformis]